MTSATINKTNRWVYICADTEGREFVQNEMGLDPDEMPTTELDNAMYFVFSPDFRNYNVAWAYAKEAQVQEFNQMAEKSLKSVGIPTWTEVEPLLRDYIKNTDPTTKSEGDYVYNFIDSLMSDIRYEEYGDIAEDYYLNMVYSDEEFLNELNKAYPIDLDTELSNITKIKESFEDITDYTCDNCGTRVPEKDITWFCGASIGLCPECRYHTTRDKLTQLDLTGDLEVLDSKNTAIKESNDPDTAWQEVEIKETLENITNNFTKASGSVQTEYEDEVSIAKRILKQHYKVVEVSDARTFDNDAVTWNISYAKPLEVK